MWGCWVMGKERFSELRRSIEGISQRMLTLTLKELQQSACPDLDSGWPDNLSGTLVIVSQKPVLVSFRFGDPPPE